MPEEQSRRESFLTAIVVVVLVAAVAMSVAIPVLSYSYLQSFSTSGPSDTSTPSVTLLTTPGSRSGTVSVDTVSREADLSDFSFSAYESGYIVFDDSLLVDGSPLVTPNIHLVFHDTDASGTLTAGDRFELSQLDPIDDYVVVLRWRPTGEQVGQAGFVPLP